MNLTLSFTGWAAVGMAALAPIGALFGAAAGAVARSGGRAPGNALGRRVAAALARAAQREFTPTVTGAIAGAVDGAIFLGAVGLVVGLVAGYGGAAPDFDIVLIAALACALLAAGAVLFGVLADGLVRGGARGLVVFCMIGMGGLTGLSLGGAVGGLEGLVGGTLLAALALTLHGREAPAKDAGSETPPERAGD